MMQFCQEYWCNRSSSADCLSSSSDSLSLVFWLTRSVDSRASTLFSKVLTFFSSIVTLDCNDSTIAFNSVTSLVVLLSFLGVSGLLLVLLPLVILLIFWYFSLLLFWFVCCFSSSYIFISNFEKILTWCFDYENTVLFLFFFPSCLKIRQRSWIVSAAKNG